MRDFGVDTILVRDAASLLRIERGSDLITDQGSIDQKTGEVQGESLLYTCLDGSPVYGTLAKLNTPNFQLTLSPGRQTAPYVKLQMSAAAYAEDNLSLHNADTLHDAMRRVESDLADSGIAWSLASASLCKAAVTRQYSVSEPVPHYMSALMACNGRRNTRKTEYGDNAVTFGNTQRSQMAYDKQGEMKAHGKDHLRCPSDLLRVEATLLKRPAVRAATGAETIPDLCRLWGHLPAVYFAEMQRDIFRLTNTPADGACLDWEAIIAMAALSPRPQAAFNGLVAPLAMVQQNGLKRSEQMICEAFSGRENRNIRGDWIRRLQIASTQLELEKVAPSGLPLKRLYLELKQKTLAPLALAA